MLLNIYIYISSVVVGEIIAKEQRNCLMCKSILWDNVTTCWTLCCEMPQNWKGKDTAEQRCSSLQQSYDERVNQHVREFQIALKIGKGKLHLTIYWNAIIAGKENARLFCNDFSVNDIESIKKMQADSPCKFVPKIFF